MNLFHVVVENENMKKDMTDLKQQRERAAEVRPDTDRATVFLDCLHAFSESMPHTLRTLHTNKKKKTHTFT